MNVWLWTAIGLLPPLCVGVWASALGPLPQRLVGLQLSSSITVCGLVALSFALDQASSTDLALTLGLLSLPGSLLLASFSERWL